MNFLQVFASLLSERNITVYQLSKATGLDESMIGKWRRGERLPSLEKAIALADYFRVSLDYLVGRDFPTCDNEEKE